MVKRSEIHPVWFQKPTGWGYYTGIFGIFDGENLDSKMLWQQSQQKIEALVKREPQGGRRHHQAESEQPPGYHEAGKNVCHRGGNTLVLVIGGFIADRFINHFSATSPFLLFAGMVQVT